MVASHDDARRVFKLAAVALYDKIISVTDIEFLLEKKQISLTESPVCYDLCCLESALKTAA